MEVNVIQITSACIVLASSLVPLNFMLGVKSDRQRFLSIILFVVLQAYVVHSLLEAFDLVGMGYQVLAKLCFVGAAFCLMGSYIVYQARAKHSVIGGLFGVAMLVSIGAWMTVEMVESTGLIVGERMEIVENIGAIFMGGFGVFLVARYFWLKHSVLLEPNYLRS